MRTGFRLILLACLPLMACGEPVAPPEPAPAARPQGGAVALSPDQITALGIRFVAATPAQEAPLGVVPGTIAPPPNARVAVAAILPGVVTRTFVVEGDRVRRGQPLAEVASREMLGIGAALERARARAEVAGASDRRLSQLAREGVIAGARADEARASAREAQAELAEQRRLLALVNGRAAGGSYTLSAPIAGRVTTAAIQTGSPVDQGAAPYVIDAAERYELTAQLPARLVGAVRPGMGVTLPGGVRGTVTSVGTVIDPATRSATLRARLPAAPGVVSGQVASVTLYGPAAAGAFLVPAAAVTTVGGDSMVFVRAASGVLPRRVRTGATADGMTVILDGLKAGEQVAANGASELKALAGAG